MNGYRHVKSPEPPVTPHSAEGSNGVAPYVPADPPTTEVIANTAGTAAAPDTGDSAPGTTRSATDPDAEADGSAEASADADAAGDGAAVAIGATPADPELGAAVAGGSIVGAGETPAVGVLGDPAAGGVGTVGGVTGGASSVSDTLAVRRFVVRSCRVGTTVAARHASTHGVVARHPG